MRSWFRTALKLSAADEAALKKSATTCNKLLADQDNLAAHAIAVAKAANAIAPPVVLTDLENGRMSIDNGCISTMQKALSSATVSANIDLFVKTVMAGKSHQSEPPHGTAPAKPLSAGGSQ